MGKYWRKTVTGDYSPMFKKWQTDISLAPHDGKIFMGRIKGTNKSRAVHWNGFKWIDPQGCELEICQWISFTDFADIRSCVWRAM